MPISQYQHPRSYYKEIIADSPISFWPFDDFAAGTVIADLAALHNGVATGDSVTKAQAGPGRGLDWAITFGGTDDGIQVGDFTDYEFAGDFTAECWMFKTSAGATSQRLISKNATNAGEWLLNSNVDGTITGATFNTASGSFLNTGAGVGPAIPLNTWAHVAMTISGTLLSVYINGVLASSTSSTTGTRRTSSAQGVAIGFNPDGVTQEFVGRLAAPAVYASALTQARLLEHVQAAMRY